MVRPSGVRPAGLADIRVSGASMDRILVASGMAGHRICSFYSTLSMAWFPCHGSWGAETYGVGGVHATAFVISVSLLERQGAGPLVHSKAPTDMKGWYFS